MMEKKELYARIEELERELAEERIRRKITEDNSDCALWEYEIASKKYVLSRKLGGKWNTTNMVIENYQEQMHNWGFVHPDDWATFDEFCAAMDRGDEHISYEVRQVSDESVSVWQGKRAGSQNFRSGRKRKRDVSKRGRCLSSGTMIKWQSGNDRKRDFWQDSMNCRMLRGDTRRMRLFIW